MSSELDALELILRIRTQGQETLNALRQSMKELDQVATTTQGKLNQALGVGDIAGPATESIKKLTGALGGLGSGSFASTIRMAIQNPLYAVGQAAEKLMLTLGPIGGTFAAIGTAAGAVGIGVYKLADSFASASREISNFAARTSLSITGAQAFAAASKIAGVNSSAFEASTRQLSSALAEGGLEGTRTSKALQTLGIQARSLTGELKPMDDLLPLIATKLSSIKDEADRNTLALTLFGRSGKELLPLLADYTKLIAAGKNTGVIINPADIENGKKLAQTFAEIGLAYDAMLNKLKIRSAGVVDNVLGAFGRGSINDAFNQADDFARNPKNAAQVAKFGYQQSTPNQGGLLGFVDQTKLQDLPGYIRSPFDTSNLKGTTSDALDRQANRDKINAILRQFDPQAAVTEAEAALKDSLSKLDPVNGTNIPAGALADIQKKSAAVDSAREQLEFPKQLAAAQKTLNEATNAQLSPIQKITAEYREQLDAISKIKGLSTDKRDHLVDFANRTRLARSGQEVVSAGQRFQEQQAQLQDLQERLGLSTRQRQAELAARLATATGRIDPGSTLGITQAFQLRTTANDQNHAAELAGIARDRNNLDLFTGSERKQREREADDRQARETARFEEENDRAKGDREVALADLKRRDAAEQEQTARRFAEITIATTKSLGSTAATRKTGSFTATPAQQVLQELQTRLQVANDAYRLDSVAASQEQDANKRAILNAENLAAISKEDYAARTTAENALYDLQKQRYEQAKSQAHSLAGALLTPGGVQGFIREQAHGFATQVLGNALTPLVGSVSDSASKIFPAGGALGNLFKGTFLQPHDEQGVSLSSNTDATSKNTLATVGLTQALIDIAAGRTPQAVSVPGVPSLPGSSAPSFYGTTVGGNATLQNILTPLIGAGLGASLGHSLAGQFEKPQLENITSIRSSFDPRFQLQHPLATLAGGTVGAGLGLLSDATRSTSAPAIPGAAPSVQQLVPIATQQLDALQSILAAVTVGVPGASGLPISIASIGDGSGTPASVASILSGGTSGGLNLTSLLAPVGNSLSSSPGSQYPSSGGDSSLDNLPAFTGSGTSSLALTAAAAKSTIGQSFSQFGKGLSHVSGPEFMAAITGQDGYDNGNGTGSAFTTASRVGAIAGGAATIAGAGLTAFHDFSQGGARGALGGATAILGAASTFLPALAPLAAVTGLVGSLLGDPKKARAAQIQQSLINETFQQSPTVDRTVDTHNMNVAFDQYGHPFSTTAQGYTISPAQTYYNPANGTYGTVPGTVSQNYNSPANVSPSQAKGPVYSGPTQAGHTVNLNISTMDSKSFLDNSPLVGAAVLKELQFSGALSQSIQSKILGS